MKTVEILGYLAANYLLFFILYGIGHIFLAILKIKSNKYSIFFYKLIVGLLILVSGYALFRSGFKSYLLTGFFLMIYWSYLIGFEKDFRKIKAKIFDVDWKVMGISFVFITIIFLLAISQIINFKGDFYTIHPDFSYYAGLSEVLYGTGIESTMIDKALIGVENYNFYHYFELWLNAIVISIFNTSSLKSILLIVFVIFSSFSTIGVYLILEEKIKYTKNKFRYIFLPFLILIVAPFVISVRWLFDIGEFNTPWNLTILKMLSIKNVIIITGLIFCYMVYNDNKKYFIFAILTLGFLYPTILVVIIPTIIIWYVISWNWFEKPSAHVFLPLLLFILSFVIIIFFSDKANHSSTSLISLIYEYYSTDSTRILNIIKEPIIRTIWLMITYSPYLLIFYLITTKVYKNILSKNRELLIFVAVAYLLGIFGITFLEFTKDGDQLFRNLFDPLFVLIFSIVLILAIIQNKERIVKFTAFVTLLVVLVFNATPVFIKASTPEVNYKLLSQLIDPKKGEIVYINSKEYYENYNNSNFYFDIPFQDLRLYLKGYFPKCLSIDKINLNTIQERAYVGSKLYSGKYYKDLISDKKSIREIIDNNKIKYVFIEIKAGENKTMQINKNYEKYEFNTYNLYIRRESNL